jgi:hypothetical protein
MASFTAGTTFTDGVANDVTAAKLGALVTNATPTSGFIQDRTAETVIASNDTVLIGDASDSNNLKRITVANFAQTLPTAKITTGTIETGTFGTTTSTAESVTTGTITTLTAGTTTSTAATITTGTIPTLVATTLITSGTGTAADPAIVPTGDTNTGIFYPAADNIAVSTNGTERVRVDSNGNVGIGMTPNFPLDISSSTGNFRMQSTTGTNLCQAQLTNGSATLRVGVETSVGGSIVAGSAAYSGVISNASNFPLAFGTNNTERLRIDSSGNVGIGTASPTTNHRLTISAADARMDVTSTNATYASLRITSNNTAYAAIDTGLASDSYTTTKNLVFQPNGGFVSIGTATALSRLHVHGDLTLSNTTTSTTGATGGVSKPATYAGFLTVSINGTSRKIPYYA